MCSSQVAFLSAMAGSDVVKAAAQAAISALYEVDLASVSSLNGKNIGIDENGKSYIN